MSKRIAVAVVVIAAVATALASVVVRMGESRGLELVEVNFGELSSAMNEPLHDLEDARAEGASSSWTKLDGETALEFLGDVGCAVMAPDRTALDLRGFEVVDLWSHEAGGKAAEIETYDLISGDTSTTRLTLYFETTSDPEPDCGLDFGTPTKGVLYVVPPSRGVVYRLSLRGVERTSFYENAELPAPQGTDLIVIETHIEAVAENSQSWPGIQQNLFFKPFDRDHLVPAYDGLGVPQCSEDEDRCVIDTSNYALVDDSNGDPPIPPGGLELEVVGSYGVTAEIEADDVGVVVHDFETGIVLGILKSIE